MNRRDELKAQIWNLRQELDAIDEKECAERNTELIGKRFRFHNSYGGGGKTWYLYQIVTALAGGNYVRVISFQTDCDGEIRIERETRPAALLGTPCSEAVVMKAWGELLQQIADIGSEI